MAEDNFLGLNFCYSDSGSKFEEFDSEDIVPLWCRV